MIIVEHRILNIPQTRIHDRHGRNALRAKSMKLNIINIHIRYAGRHFLLIIKKTEVL